MTPASLHVRPAALSDASRRVAPQIDCMTILSDALSFARRAAMPEGTLRLPGGAVVRVRPLRTTDGTLLREAFARLSPDSRRSRFFLPIRELSDSTLTRMTDVDGRDRAAVLAVSPEDGRGVGVARYVRSTEDPTRAEIAVTVADEIQGKGLGPRLLRELAKVARDAGIDTFTMDVLSDNLRARRALRTFGAEWVGREDDVVKYSLAVGGLSPPRLALTRDHSPRRFAGELSLRGALALSIRHT